LPPAKIVTLTTDFGLTDPYVAEMKGTILGICPKAIIVDVTHNIKKFSIRMGAHILASAVPYFPSGTIHVAVVDPSVGTQRRPIIVQTARNTFVGPDNGLLMIAAETQEIIDSYKIDNRKFMLSKVSSTFHGRDIFSAAAAHLANDVSMKEFGPKITDTIKLKFTKVKQNKNMVIGEVLHVDDFGNIITNISKQDIEKLKKGTLRVELPKIKLYLKVAKTYAEAKPQEPIVLIGSHNYLEIALNQGNAATKFQTLAGDKIILSPT